MDIRDITVSIPFPEGKTIETIFELQASLLSEYVKIEKLTMWPYNLNLPASQVILKDFIARIVEELGEAFESYEKLFATLVVGQLRKDKVLNNLYNFNEELADALHFLIEAMIVSGITPAYLKEWAITSNFPMNVTADTREDLYRLYSKPENFNPTVSPELEGLWGYHDTFILGGRQVNLEAYNQLAMHSWQVTYFLQLARNSLKNKPWKQTHMNSDFRVYKEAMAKTLVAFLELTSFMGITEEALFTIYYRKNQINHFRVRSNY